MRILLLAEQHGKAAPFQTEKSPCDRELINNTAHESGQLANKVLGPAYLTFMLPTPDTAALAIWLLVKAKSDPVLGNEDLCVFPETASRRHASGLRQHS